MNEIRTTYGGNARIIAVSDCCVLVNRVSEDIAAYDRISGEQRWSIPSDRGFANAFVESHTIYVVNRGITALDDETGNILWTYGDHLISSSAYSQGFIYYSYDQGGKITAFAYDTVNQNELWAVPLRGSGPSKVLYAEDYVLVTSHDHIFVFNPDTGQVWSKEIQTLQMPVVLEGVIYVTEGFTRSLRAMQLNTGEDLGYLSVRLPVIFEPELNSLTTTENLIIFADGKTVYGYGK
jgi:outer membrane protein assembly factor BamB